MKLKIVKFIASCLMVVVATCQAALGDTVMSDFATSKSAIASTSSAMLFEAQNTETEDAAQPESDKIDSDRPEPNAEPNPAPPTSAKAKDASSKPPAKKAKPASKGKSSISASRLFANKKSPGSIAVGAAEGNLNLKGKATSLYLGHIDPGNQVTNRGFCSWNKAKNLNVPQADAKCLDALQRQSAATERKLAAVGIGPKRDAAALVNGTDLWNQSNSAGPKFARSYKKALKKGLKGNKAFINARVEAFRNSKGDLDASGLFKICGREPYYKSQLQGYEPFSESWRWSCIALDQGRRVKIVSKALRQNLKNVEIPLSDDADIIASSAPVQNAAKPRKNRRIQDEVEQVSAAEFSPALNFEPDAIAANSDVIDVSFSTPSARVRDRVAKQASQIALSFEPVVELDNSATDLPTADESITDETTIESNNSPKPNHKITPQVGDKVAGYRVTSRYGNRIHPIRRRSHFHGGVDVATPTDTNLYAIGKPGTKTTLKCWKDGKGGGLVATMTSDSFPNRKFDALHLSWCKAKTNGAQINVDAGEIVAGTGNTGRSTGPHLHFQVRDKKSGKRISPNKELISWVLTGKPPKTSQN